MIVQIEGLLLDNPLTIQVGVYPQHEVNPTHLYAMAVVVEQFKRVLLMKKC